MWPAVKSYSICVGGNRHSGCPLEGCSLVVGGMDEGRDLSEVVVEMGKMGKVWGSLLCPG